LIGAQAFDQENKTARPAGRAVFVMPTAIVCVTPISLKFDRRHPFDKPGSTL
jgi:hypothetical protein